MTKILKIDHLGIAVKNLDEAIGIYQTLLGVAPDSIQDVPSEGLKAAFFKVGDVHLELLEPQNPESVIAKFIAKNGRGGFHHLSLEVSDLDAKLHELKAQGFELIDEVPRLGAHQKRVAFLHPRSSASVLIELSQSVEGV